MARRVLQDGQSIALELDFLAAGQHQPVPPAQTNGASHLGCETNEGDLCAVVSGYSHHLEIEIWRIGGDEIGRGAGEGREFKSSDLTESLTVFRGSRANEESA